MITEILIKLNENKTPWEIYFCGNFDFYGFKLFYHIVDYTGIWIVP